MHSPALDSHNHQRTHRCWTARRDGSGRRPSRFRAGTSRSDLLMYVCVCLCPCLCLCACMHIFSPYPTPQISCSFLSHNRPSSVSATLSFILFFFQSAAPASTPPLPSPFSLSFFPPSSPNPSLPLSLPHHTAHGRLPRPFLRREEHHPLHQKRILR